jgi:gamma-glutamyltranspeptidase / glutathione hydrolase
MKRTNTCIFAAFIASAALLSLSPLTSLAAQSGSQQAPARGAAQQSNGPLEYKETDIAKLNWPRSAVTGSEAMVASDNALADKAGLEILKKGGNAVDAAVAVAFALAVVEPRAGNIGGGGFMLVRLADGRTNFIDYREEAPAKASREMYKKDDGTYDKQASVTGYRAVGVPGTVAGMALAEKTYGRMKLADVMVPAIRLANGFTVTEKLATSLRDATGRLEKFDRSKHIFLNDGQGYAAGSSFKQPDLAATLERIAKNGPDEFYKGETAKALADDMSQNGGLITMEDLAAYKAKQRQPLRASYTIGNDKWDVLTSPPPSSGGIAMIEALNILSPESLKGWNDANSVHWVAEAMRLSFADRAAFLADADFVHVPTKGLTDARYAAERRQMIDPAHAGSSESEGAGNPVPFDGAMKAAPAAGQQQLEELSLAQAQAFAIREAQREGHTTHFSVVDSDGNAVSNTYTINDSYGAAVTAPGGFLLNDEMDDFTADPGQPNMFGLTQSDANDVAPGHRPLSSMMPTILLRNGKLSFVTGSPGGPQIISATMLTVLNWMRFGPLDSAGAMAAINSPRFHHQWMPDVLIVEQSFPKTVEDQLTTMGYKVVRRTWIGEVNAIGIDPKTGARLGAADPRRQGAAQGY